MKIIDLSSWRPLTTEIAEKGHKWQLRINYPELAFGALDYENPNGYQLVEIAGGQPFLRAVEYADVQSGDKIIFTLDDIILGFEGNQQVWRYAPESNFITEE